MMTDGGEQVVFAYIIAGDFYLVVDTGTKESYVTQALCENRSWVAQSGERKAIGISGAETRFRKIVINPTLDVQGLVLSWDEAWILPDDGLNGREPFGPLHGRLFGGLLGSTAIQNTAITFGMNSATLAFSSSKINGFILGPHNIGLAILDNTVEPFMIDTGFNGQLVRLVATPQSYKVSSNSSLVTRWLGQIYPVVSGKTSVLEFVDKLSLGQTQIVNYTLATLEVEAFSDNDTPANRLLIGLDFLRQTNAVVDLRRHILLLPKRIDFLKGNDVDKLAISLEKGPIGWVVGSILPSHPLYKVGLRQGDTILQSTKGISQSELDAILEFTQSRVIKVKRNGKETVLSNLKI